MTAALTIRPYQIDGLLDRLPAGIGTLSLDCFDTLIWRNTHAPTDVFAHLGLPGGGVEARTMAEGDARRLVHNRTGKHEIGIADIYRRLYRAADEAAIDRAVADELSLEGRHAFAFAPVVALIRTAKARGMRVVIVSDMYLTQAQLRAHIAAAAGEDVLALIDQVFVSYDHGTGKTGDLFDIVLGTLGVAAETVVHMGDNRGADYVSAAAHGLHAVHLLQFDAETEIRLRQEAVAATMIDAAARVSAPVCQPYRAQIALRREQDAAFVLGHDVLGPVFHSFATWLKNELDAMAEATGRAVRPLFLMRDGFLPFETFSRLHPDAGAAKVEISRLVAARASMYDEASIEAYMAEWIDQVPLRTLARHMMLFDHEVAGVLRQGDTPAARHAFARLVRGGDLQRKILKRTRAYGDRLMTHLRRAGVEQDDAVMLVDLGYSGSAQNVVEPVLRERMGLTVAGRYLLLREGQITGLDKRGMLDTRTMEFRTLHAMASNVAVIEQLCTVEQGSTTDFTADGAPIREGADRKAAHSETRVAVQAACIAFVERAGAGVHRAPTADSPASRVAGAAAILARLLFLPNAREVRLFATFDHDVNLGSNEVVKLFDADDAARGMRHRGLHYVNTRRRMYVPGEVHAHGFPVSMAMFASARFGLDLRSTDFEVGGVEVPVLLLGDEDGGIVEATAFPTAEGFYRLLVAVGGGRLVPGIQLGHVCEWLQIEAVTYTPAATLDQPGAQVIAAPYLTDGMEQIGPGLYRADPAGLMMVPPPSASEPLVLAVVFRPIHRRGETKAIAQAA